MTFKKPFKSVPIRPAQPAEWTGRKNLKGLDEFNRPLWSPPRSKEAISLLVVAVGLFIGACLGLAYLFWSG